MPDRRFSHVPTSLVPVCQSRWHRPVSHNFRERDTPPIPRESRGDWAGLMRHPRITAPPFFCGAEIPLSNNSCNSKVAPSPVFTSSRVTYRSLYNLTHCSTSFYLWAISQSSHLSPRASHLHFVAHALL